MKQTVSLTDNYRKRLRDEISTDGLRGEVEIQVKNKETGEIESTQRKNLIVYGGREWLLSKSFASSAIKNDSDRLQRLRNSEILWFGVGSGGGEPGNPLQCGTTYGSDNDLYNPVRLRSEFDGFKSSNPNYASRIINGRAIKGYYKKISYISIKEDLANPYKSNGTTFYPNLIAEVRLEISTDDCCGQTYLEKDYEKSYSDINEAALFIADARETDPGNPSVSHLTHMDVDYYNYDPNYNRYYYESMNVLPDYYKSVDGKKYEWKLTDEETLTSKPFVNNSIQYFDVYYKQVVTDPKDSNYERDGVYYYITKICDKPVLYGIYDSGSINNCTGSLELIEDNQIVTIFSRNGKSVKKTIKCNLIPEGVSIETLDNLEFLSHGTIFVKCDRYNAFEEGKEITVTCKYKNSYEGQYVVLRPEDNSIFDVEGTIQQKVFIFPEGFTFDENGNLITCKSSMPFNNFSIIRITQQTDYCLDIKIKSIVVDENSTECRIYVSNDTIKNITEGLKIFTPKQKEGSMNYIPQDNPATVTEVYDVTQDQSTSEYISDSYFVIDRKNLVSEDYEEGDELDAKLYSENLDSAYKMFNRVTFSTIRLSHSREVLLIWRIYF